MLSFCDLQRKADTQKASVAAPMELDERFLPPEWLTGTIPRKTPYVPQMGDELMYFRQGHELYLQAVEKHKSYKISSNISLPWQKNPHLRVGNVQKSRVWWENISAVQECFYLF